MSKSERRDLGLFVLWVLILLLVESLAHGCAHAATAKPAKPAPIEVRVVEMPAREPDPTCYIDEFPQPPDPIELKLEEDDIIRRTFVHYLQLNQDRAWAHDVAIWGLSVRECLERRGLIEP